MRQVIDQASESLRPGSRSTWNCVTRVARHTQRPARLTRPGPSHSQRPAVHHSPLSPARLARSSPSHSQRPAVHHSPARLARSSPSHSQRPAINRRGPPSPAAASRHRPRAVTVVTRRGPPSLAAAASARLTDSVTRRRGGTKAVVYLQVAVQSPSHAGLSLQGWSATRTRGRPGRRRSCEAVFRVEGTPPASRLFFMYEFIFIHENMYENIFYEFIYELIFELRYVNTQNMNSYMNSYMNKNMAIRVYHIWRSGCSRSERRRR